ncbi:peptide ABC transporter, ATP binding protein [Candidatus Omnitrophus magneticus]|uniref:Peptide ABC transporter, ATP binding protein n=1 Tax=Candidatus Omnitrophus magneticus TaxID=1609969 RepID=A0A0F0CWI1_9BACT|nr:peptide ABC transporter, ATP binding protein [Candidatus Omnitrophus magneticus]
MNGINFTVKENEILALVGSSGSGKTITAFSLLKLLPKGGVFTNGKIFFQGKDILKLNERDVRALRGKDISMVFQEPLSALNPLMRIGEQISEIFTAHSIRLSKTEISLRVKELFFLVKLPERTGDSYPHELSGGMRQRVLIAMAIALSPKLLILDEPVTSLDVTIQKHILDLIKEIQIKNRMAVLFITHDFSLVNMLAERVCVMRDGEIVETASKKEILNNPCHEYTKALIECMPRLGATSNRFAVPNFSR